MLAEPGRVADLEVLLRQAEQALLAEQRTSGELRLRLEAAEKEVQARGLRLAALAQERDKAQRDLAAVCEEAQAARAAADRAREQLHRHERAQAVPVERHLTRCIAEVLAMFVEDATPRLRLAAQQPLSNARVHTVRVGLAFGSDRLTDLRKSTGGPEALADTQGIRARGRIPVVVLAHPAAALIEPAVIGVLAVGEEESADPADLRLLLAEDAHAG